jgi:uncharacterized damage-inducible protein DinB
MNFFSNWVFARKLTIDLLNSLSEADLLWTPGKEVGQFWKQFRHIGRVQEDYMDALINKSINFSLTNKHYNGVPDRNKLIEYFRNLDQILSEKLHQIDFAETIDWFGEKVDISEHLSRMLSHEVLHHGQFIVYCQLLKKQYPESWSIWGF